MYFKVKQAYEKEVDGNKKVFVTGFLKPQTEDETEGLDLLVEIFSEIETYNNKFTSNGKTLLFKSVEADLLMNNLKLLAKECEFKLKFLVSKNFVGSKDLIEKMVRNM